MIARLVVLAFAAALLLDVAERVSGQLVLTVLIVLALGIVGRQQRLRRG